MLQNYNNTNCNTFNLIKRDKNKQTTHDNFGDTIGQERQTYKATNGNTFCISVHVHLLVM